MTRARRLAALLVLVGSVGAVPVARSATVDCLPPEGGYGVLVEREVPFVNRFGERIAVDLHRPTGVPASCRFPVVLESSAYRDWIAPQEVDALTEDERRAWWVRRGYVFAFADVPGTGASEGTWCMFCVREQQSGVDIVYALGTQAWSNGNVGMVGGSYPAITAMLVAQHRPKHLKAVIAAAFATDVYDDFIFPGGMPRGEDWQTIVGVFSYIDALSATRDMDFAAIQDEHPLDDSWFADRRLHPERVKVPVYVLGGWNDIFDRSTWETFDRLGSKVKVLRQGPFTHVPFFVQDDAWPCAEHDADFCGAPLFDRYLRGVDTPEWGALAANPVQVYVEPHDGWHRRTAKPATSPWQMTLGPPGTTATVRHDPTAGATGGRWFLRGSVPGTYPPIDYVLGVDGPADQRAEEAKVVSIATAPLAHDVTIVGGGTVSLLLNPSADDADIAVRIVDEFPVGSAQHPAGYAYRVGGGWLRASHRFGNDAGSLAPLTPGTWTRVEVPLWPIGYRFAAGHRIRIDLAGADVPRFLPPERDTSFVVDLGASEVTLPAIS